MSNSYRLLITCPDQVGIVANVSSFIAEREGWLLEASYHSDEDSGLFFMRNEIKADSLSVSLDEFRAQFAKLANKHQMQWQLIDANTPKKMLILASHASHCVADLLHRWHSGDLNCEIPAVIANHNNLESMVKWHGVDFHHVPFEAGKKVQAYEHIEALLEQYQPDFIVLARFMQIIPPHLCKQYAGRMINIHHSFLPSFIGSNPYQKAYDRGVKLIGATCHYVTEDLDEGPIIEQDVVRINHRHNKDDMVRLGKDVEATVLARGVGHHLEDRICINGHKTVILD